MININKNQLLLFHSLKIFVCFFAVTGVGCFFLLTDIIPWQHDHTLNGNCGVAFKAIATIFANLMLQTSTVCWTHCACVSVFANRSSVLWNLFWFFEVFPLHQWCVPVFANICARAWQWFMVWKLRRLNNRSIETGINARECLLSFAKGGS